ncbi:MAG: PPC domain-containing DNA-binding protein [Casimicrobiaceae bacterium]
MTPLPVRLHPGDDLRQRIETLVQERNIAAAFVLSGIGSLSRVALRHAGAPHPEVREGDFEIIALAGSLSAEGAHLHMAIADCDGRVTGGHVAAGCRVRTTAEILLAILPGWTFARRRDAATGYPELAIERDH